MRRRHRSRGGEFRLLQEATEGARGELAAPDLDQRADSATDLMPQEGVGRHLDDHNRRVAYDVAAPYTANGGNALIARERREIVLADEGRRGFPHGLNVERTWHVPGVRACERRAQAGVVDGVPIRAGGGVASRVEGAVDFARAADSDVLGEPGVEPSLEHGGLKRRCGVEGGHLAVGVNAGVCAAGKGGARALSS